MSGGDSGLRSSRRVVFFPYSLLLSIAYVMLCMPLHDAENRCMHDVLGLVILFWCDTDHVAMHAG